MFLCCAKLLSLIRCHLFFFINISVALGDWPKKILVRFMSGYVLPLLSCSLMISCLMFEVFKPFWVLFLCRVWGYILTSLTYMQPSKFPSTAYWRDCLFPVVYSCLLCQRLINDRCVGLFLGSLFCPIIPSLVFVPVTTLFYCSFLVLSEVWESYASCFVCFLRIALAVLGFLWFHINFWII